MARKTQKRASTCWKTEWKNYDKSNSWLTLKRERFCLSFQLNQWKLVMAVSLNLPRGSGKQVNRYQPNRKRKSMSTSQSKQDHYMTTTKPLTQLCPRTTKIRINLSMMCQWHHQWLRTHQRFLPNRLIKKKPKLLNKRLLCWTLTNDSSRLGEQEKFNQQNKKRM